VIHVENLRYRYPPAVPGADWDIALDGVTFDVPPGACVAVTGPNNAGKSTLCVAVAGLAPRLAAGEVEGRIVVDGRDVQAEPPGALADVIGLVLQDPTGQLFNPTVADEIAWGLENLGLPRAEMRRRVDWALDVVGLDDVPPDQPPGTLSGGQAKRLALAAALALQPRVLVLDEPSGGLAPAGRAEMIAVLRDLRAREGLTILFASNDAQAIAALADEVILLRAGRIAARGRPRPFFLSASADPDPSVETPPASRFAAVANHRPGVDLDCLTVEEAANQAARYPLNGHTPPHAGPPAPAPTEEPAIALEGVSFAYEPSRPVLRGVDLRVPTGQFAALVGDNGAGKTTLARHLIGLLRPTAGLIRIFGGIVNGQPIGRMARQVGFAFQNPEVQIFSPTVREEIAFGPRNLGMGGAALDAAVEDALRGFGLIDVADHPPAALSFSTRRMVALAAIAAMETPILVLDEPTVGLDAAGQSRVLGWLADRRRAGTTILFITHDMELAARCADRVIVLAGGNVAADGPPHDVFAQPGVLFGAGLEPPFAVRFADRLGRPALAADLTPEGAARAWLESLS
jgi:energy-coupling factor transporter ATP-binding protein EcfA2